MYSVAFSVNMYNRAHGQFVKAANAWECLALNHKNLIIVSFIIQLLGMDSPGNPM